VGAAAQLAGLVLLWRAARRARSATPAASTAPACA